MSTETNTAPAVTAVAQEGASVPKAAPTQQQHPADNPSMVPASPAFFPQNYNSERAAATVVPEQVFLVAEEEVEAVEVAAKSVDIDAAYDPKKEKEDEADTLSEDEVQELPFAAALDWGEQVDTVIATADGARAAPGHSGSEESSALAGDGSGSLLALAGIAAAGAGIYFLVDDDDEEIDLPPANMAPTITSDETVDVDENVPVDSVIYTAMATDPDGDEIIFGIEGDDADAFTIDEDTGEVRLVASPDFEMNDSYSISIVATDTEGNQATQDLVVTINDVEEGPTPEQYDALLNQVAFNLTGEDAFRNADEIFITNFTALNSSGVSGVAVAGYDDDTDMLTVSIMADGLEPNQVHPQHIHGFMPDDDGTVADAMIPTLAVDADNDGFIELSEGAETYGPVLLSLTSGGDFPMADASGSLSFTQTYSLPEQDLGDEPMLALREIVLHGLTLEQGEGGNGGEADGTAGYKATLPVAAGELESVDADGGQGILQFIAAFGDDGDFAEDFGLLASALTGNVAYEEADRFFFTPYTPLNASEVSGIGLIGFDVETSTITVTIQASGLEPGQVHPQHIHGFMEDGGTVAEAMVPTLDVDADGDGFIELMEGAETYGPVLLSLMSGDDFPTADANGNISFTESYQLPEQDLSADPLLDLREIVLHGKTLAEGEGGNGGEADGTAGYKATLPVAAGALEEVLAFDAADLQLMLDAFAQTNAQASGAIA